MATILYTEKPLKTRRPPTRLSSSRAGSHSRKVINHRFKEPECSISDHIVVQGEKKRYGVNTVFSRPSHMLFDGPHLLKRYPGFTRTRSDRQARTRNHTSKTHLWTRLDDIVSLFHESPFNILRRPHGLLNEKADVTNF